MKPVWEKGIFEGHAESLKNGQNKAPSQPPGVLPGVNAVSEPLQSTTSESPDKKLLPAATVPIGSGQNPLLLTPASLQLAQLQAQLTLHRLKLAQTAVNSGSAAAATVLNQVLSNVAMSQPLFNPLRTSAMVSTPHGHAGGAQLGPGFPSNALAFPPPVVGGNFGGGGGFQNQNAGSVRFGHIGGGSSQPHSQHVTEYGKISGFPPGPPFLPNSDRCGQFGFLGATSSTPSTTHDAQQAKGANSGAFQRDFNSSDGRGPLPSFTGEQTLDSFTTGSHKEKWQTCGNFPPAGNLEAAQNSAGAWASAGQKFYTRGELYNPEEPTPDAKFNPVGGQGFGAGTQGFVGYQPGEEASQRAPVPLLPHQLNDFHGVTPSLLPHHCTICDKKVYNLKDWDQHVKGKLHLENRALFSEGLAGGSVQFLASSEGCVNSPDNSMAYSSAATQDTSSGPTSSYFSTESVKTHLLPGAAYSLPQTGSKFLPRKVTAGRVVHICNLPEGSCTENDVINLGLPFGKVTNYILMRSTHQAFLEMAYIEAAQAMVKYYQLQPAMINDQKLLIRMSKRYKELQLKKPGKDVESIIQDINSQRERDEMQQIDRYPAERTRSRSPISRSLSPRSHSPGFTSCSSGHSPSGACRGDWGNSLGPRRGSWDWSSHAKRDEEREEACWRNGDDDRPNGRLSDWRKPYLKLTDRMSPRSAEEWTEGLRCTRDWYPRGSPQGMPFSLYRSKEEDFYKKELVYKSEKLQRVPYQRHETKSKRKDSSEHYRSRHTDSDPLGDPPAPRSPEDRKAPSPAKGRSKKVHRKQEAKNEERESQSQGETEPELKDAAGSPPCHGSERDRESEVGQWDSGDEKEESWYPKNMEELVTVDEVGEEEDDGMVEPDLPDLQEEATAKEQAKDEVSRRSSSETSKREGGTNEMTQEGGTALSQQMMRATLSSVDAIPEDSPPDLEVPEKSSPDPSQELQAASQETCTCTDTDTPVAQSPIEQLAGHEGGGGGREPVHVLSGSAAETTAPVSKETNGDAPHKDGTLGMKPKKDLQNDEISDPQNPSQSRGSAQTDDGVKSAPSATWEHDRALGEHSIPLGVEFIVPRSGFYCKLCDLFYASEETAKTSHCRSTVHYRNLQKYLSQLAEESLLSTNTSPP